MKRVPVLIVLSCSVGLAVAPTRPPRIQVVPHEVAPRVDVLVQGKPYTAYVYLRSLPRPALRPVYAASGAVVAEEALWFAHADVNGIDFSGDAGSRDDAHRGRVLNRRVIEAAGSDEEGQLGVEMAWMGPGDTLTLVEDVRFIFRDDAGVRSIDRLTRLSAVRGAVRLAHNAEGTIGVRLAQGFSGARTAFVAPGGRIDRAAVSGTRSPWLAVEGAAGSARITVALLDHPQNPGFPNAWRFDEPGILAIAATSDVRIDAGRSATFRHRLVVFPGRVNPAAVEAEFQRFSAPAGPQRLPVRASASPPRTGRRSQGS